MRKKSGWLSFALGVLPVLLIGKTAQAFSLSLLPSVQNVFVGDKVEVDVAVSGLGDGIAPSLGFFDLDVSFDPSLLSFSSAVFGDQLDLTLSGLTIAEIDPGTGTVAIVEISGDGEDDLNTMQAGNFILARLTFKAIGAGSSFLDLTANELGDAGEGSLIADGLFGTTVEAKPRDTSIPESDLSPVSLGLVVGLGSLLARKKAAQTFE